MKLHRLAALAIVLFATLTACADTAALDQGEVIIQVEGQNYKLPLVTCFSAEFTEDGKQQTVLTISSHRSRIDKTPGPRFAVAGVQAPQKGTSSSSALTKFSLRIGGGVMKGGSRYTGLLPIDSYQDNKLHYQGQGESLKMDAQTGKPQTSMVDIEISLVCD